MGVITPKSFPFTRQASAIEQYLIYSHYDSLQNRIRHDYCLTLTT